MPLPIVRSGAGNRPASEPSLAWTPFKARWPARPLWVIGRFRPPRLEIQLRFRGSPLSSQNATVWCQAAFDARGECAASFDILQRADENRDHAFVAAGTSCSARARCVLRVRVGDVR